jgi:serine/threonine protein kinase
MVGQTIGKYRVQDRIGRGGMGTVYLAVDATLHREVAIKVLNSELNDPEVARRFRAEAITVARLSHPGIATVYELFEHDGQWLMVMEFVRGETLERLVERTGPLPIERAVELCTQALTALAHAHSMGVVHRDLKPANLMITETGAVKIMDFGIARVAGSEHLTTAGFMMGTPAYMAPEQVLGHEIDARADLYAMGVVLYRLATARLPFKGDTPFAMAQSQVNDPPTPVGLMREGLPPWTEQVLGRALSKAPEDRFQTADEFRETLKRALAGLPLESAPNAFVPPELLLTTPPRTIATGPTPVRPTTAPIPVAAAPPASPESTQPTVLAGQIGPTTGHTAAPTGQTGAAAVAAPTTGAVQTSATAARTKSNLIPIAIAAAVIVIGTVVAGVWYRSRSATVEPTPDATPPAPAASAGDAGSVAGAAGQPTTPPPAPATSGATTAPGTAVPNPPSTPASAADAAAGAGASGAKPTPPATGTAPAGDASGAGRSSPNGPPAPRAGGAPATTGTAPTTTGATPTRAAGPGARGPVETTPDVLVAFGNTKMLVVTDKKGQDQDVVLNFVAGQISVVPKKGGASIAAMPYKGLAKATYIHAKDPKWDPTLPSPPDGLDIPGFMRGARHWLILQTTTSYLIFHLDDSNWSDVLSTVEARTGVKVDRPTPGGA